MAIDLILGTAGHIDHGKTALVHALTGVSTDRLPEEKRRGITIDLGFAQLELGPYRLGIVDVPGHERFVRNMLAGATGMDVALLVVAADDSVKPQTIEHLEILRWLNLPAGVIALTKCDLVSDEWLELVQQEVRQAVADSFLADAPIVPTSVVTGTGLDELRSRLQEAADQAWPQRRETLTTPFRLAVDRAFTVPGHGVVVTGTVSSGQAAVGDELEVQPGGIRARVRGLHRHDKPAQSVHRGQRAGINLAGVRLEDVRRGSEVGAVGQLVPTRILTTKIQLSVHCSRPLKRIKRVRVHLGAGQHLAQLRLLDQTQLEPGGQAWAQLYLEDEAVAQWRQPFVLRSESPVTTIGGGIVVATHARPLRNLTEIDLQMLADLSESDSLQRAAAAAYFYGLRNWDKADLGTAAAVAQPAAMVSQLVEQQQLEVIPISAQRERIVHHRWIERLEQRIARILGRLHDAQPLRTAFPRSAVAVQFGRLDEPAIVQHILDRLVRDGRLRSAGGDVGLADRGPQLSQNERRLLQQLIDTYRTSGLDVPTLTELQARAARNQASVPQLIEIAAASGELVKLTEQLYLHRDTDLLLQQRLRAQMNPQVGATMSEIRDILQTSRKYAVPYCEYLDRIGFTRREGDRRWLQLATVADQPGNIPQEQC